MGYNIISPTVFVLVLRSRDESSPKLRSRRVVAWPSRVNLTRLVFMDFDFRCNRLSCRKSLTDKAVVTTCEINGDALSG